MSIPILIPLLIVVVPPYAHAQNQSEMYVLSTLDSTAEKDENESKCAEAVNIYETIINITTSWPTASPVIAGHEMVNMASALNCTKQPEKAEAVLLEAQQILRQHPNTRDPIQEAVLLGNLADSQRLEGEYADAENSYWEAIDEINKHPIASGPFFQAADKAGLSMVYLHEKNCALAMRFHNEAMKTFAELLPKNPIPISNVETDYDALLKKTPLCQALKTK